MSHVIIDGCAIATVDGGETAGGTAASTEYARGHILISDGLIKAVGDGPAPPDPAAERIDGSGCLATPGLVNTHHHLYQWATRGMVQQGTLFEWLSALYPVWARIDAETVRAAARAALTALATSGCSTSTDHHYIFPRRGGDVLGSTVAAASEVGIRFHPCRGSMDLGESAGGLPPDTITETTSEALAGTDEAISRYHDPSPGSMLRVAVAPCSPFTASSELMRESAALARRRGVRLHTHLAETADEQEYCQRHFGQSPLRYIEDLGWLGDDVWFAHGVHLSGSDIARLGATGTSVAHCPTSNARLGAGIAPLRPLLSGSVPVGLGVDGAASNEAGRLAPELRQAVLAARVRGDGSDEPPGGRAASSGKADAPSGNPAALTAREALRLATMGGARCLGRSAELGSLEAGKLADVALWRLDGIDHADISDPAAALVLGGSTRVERLLVGGQTVVTGGRLPDDGMSEAAIVAAAREARQNLVSRAESAGVPG